MVSSGQDALVSRPTIGSTVWIRYKGGVEGQAPRDDRSEGDPVRFVLGMSSLPRGIEEAIMTLGKGEAKTFKIPPKMGYGELQEKYMEWHPRPLLERGYELKKGSMLFWRNPEDGTKMPAWVREEKQDIVLIDFNHPFAGETLEYWIELVDYK